jgi:hypothetical protein
MLLHISFVVLENSARSKWHRACAEFAITYVILYEENMIPYKGYLILGKALRVHPHSPEWWRSQGSVFTNGPAGVIHIKHLDEGFIFESKKAAEAHGLELCKKWVDGNLKASDEVSE